MKVFENGKIPENKIEYDRIQSENLSSNRYLPAADWESLGPDGLEDGLTGRMTCFAFNPYNSKILLAGSNAGGLWKTTNGGESWFVINDKIPTPRISAVAYNPADTNHIIIGTGFYYYDQYILWPGTGLFETFDGGKTWGQNSLKYNMNENQAINRIIWNPNDANIIYTAATTGLWKSSDYGKNWINILDGNVIDLDIVTDSPNIIFASVKNDGIYKSLDSGISWQKLIIDLPDKVDRIALDICQSYPNQIVASFISASDFSSLGIFKSSNSGEIWKKINNAPEHVCFPQIGCYGWFVNQIGISPVDTNNIIFGGLRMYVTTNGGINWSLRDYYSVNAKGPFNGLSYVDQFAFGFDPEEPSTVYAFNDGGVAKSLNKGIYWEKKNKGLVTSLVIQFSSCDDDPFKIVCGLQDQGMQFLDNTNGNIKWKRWNHGDASDVVFDPLNSNKAYGNIFGNLIRNTNLQNGINSTQNINSGFIGNYYNSWRNALIHHPTKSNTLFIANDEKIFKSINGTSWTASGNIPNVMSLAISKSDPNIMYAAAYNINNADSHSFYISKDEGKTWIKTLNSPGWRITDIEVDPQTSHVVYVTLNAAKQEESHVYRSINNGESWTALSNGLPDVSTNAVTVNPFNSSVIYVATDIGVFISENEGEQWTPYNDNLPPYQILDMHYHSLDSTLRISTIGRGIWKTKSFYNGNTNIVEQNEINDNFNVYPNPFTNRINLTFKIKKQDHFCIKLLNSLGQEVDNIFNDYLQNGTFEFTYDGAKLMSSNQQYYISIVNNKRKKLFPILKI